MARAKGPVFRVTGLLASQLDDELTASLRAAIDDSLTEEERPKKVPSIAIVPSCYRYDEKIALVEFHGGVPEFLSGLNDNPFGDWQVEMGDTDISFDQHFFGFTQLYTPKADSPVTADVIAITGLDGHAYGSWRGKGNLGRMWLRDFLSKDLPFCRTMTYGYNSKLLSHGIDTIMDYGRGLLEELKKVRNTEELRKRPLFFVAHSFGGIILAHCLVKAVQATNVDHPTIASLYKATYGMLLFGIPHKGLVIDDIGKMLAREEESPRSALLKQIRVKSDLLAVQLADFKNLIRDRKIVSFYETGQTRRLEFVGYSLKNNAVHSESKRWKRTGDFVTVVETDSALLQLPDFIEEKIPVDADHSTIVKFDFRNHPGYTSAREKLTQFEREAPQVVAARFSMGQLQHKPKSHSIVSSQSEAISVMTIRPDLGPATSVTFMRDGKCVAGSLGNGNIGFWNTQNGTCSRMLIGDGELLERLVSSPDRKLLAWSSYNGTINIWDTVNKSRLISLDHQSTTKLSFSPDNKYILSASKDGRARIWNLETKELFASIHEHPGTVHTVAYSMDGTRVITASLDEIVSVWDVSTMSLVCRIHADDCYINAIAITPDSKHLVTAGYGTPATARLWNMSNGRCVRTFFGHQKDIISVAFSHNGKYLLTGSADLDAKVWDIQTGVCVRNLRGHKHTVNSVAFSLDDNYIATASWDGIFKIWDVSDLMI
ncbi:hypothetical protein yc1106_10105 [Curvularia clavata]|uniref:Uncharacterized protein n=1 Tax=Curvularia clavata TaxID=95742 RepID=A0A9Q8ZIV8_CURCL|nr:hypothetical protein yc1106_10105 [Curvularia clavata]